jgi:hypothetical protein
LRELFTSLPDSNRLVKPIAKAALVESDLELQQQDAKESMITGYMSTEE